MEGIWRRLRDLRAYRFECCDAQNAGAALGVRATRRRRAEAERERRLVLPARLAAIAGTDLVVRAVGVRATGINAMHSLPDFSLVDAVAVRRLRAIRIRGAPSRLAARQPRRAARALTRRAFARRELTSARRRPMNVATFAADEIGRPLARRRAAANRTTRAASVAGAAIRAATARGRARAAAMARRVAATAGSVAR